MIKQDAATLTVTRTSQSGEVTTRSNRRMEKKNTLNFQGNAIEQLSKTKWDGGTLHVDTSMNFDGNAVNVTMAMSLDPSGNLVIVSTPGLPGRRQPGHHEGHLQEGGIAATSAGFRPWTHRGDAHACPAAYTIEMAGRSSHLAHDLRQRDGLLRVVVEHHAGSPPASPRRRRPLCPVPARYRRTPYQTLSPPDSVIADDQELPLRRRVRGVGCCRGR